LTFFPQTNFESFAPVAASYSNVIVPIVSFKELLHSDWKRLPAPVASGFNGGTNVVVLTHLDQVSQKGIIKQLKTLEETSWQRGLLNTSLVIPCSSLSGLSATDLLDRSKTTKPLFKAIWEKHTVGYHVREPLFSIACAEQPSSVPPKF